jgi:hypothetical protein
MSRRAAAFSQADVARALRAAEQVAPGRLAVEIDPDGTIRLIPAPVSDKKKRANLPAPVDHP